MFGDKKIAAVIVAGGKGTRLKSEVPKQFLCINGKPVLQTSVDAFSRNRNIDYICVVTNEKYIRETEAMLPKDKYSKVVAVTAGGEQRQDSVAAGIRALAEFAPDYEYVAIHDGARPYVADKVINDGIEKAVKAGACVAAVPVKDTIRSGDITLERSNLYAVQTPQTFKREIIEAAYEKAYSDGYYGTDDGSVVERLGVPVIFSLGDYRNIKITTEEDMPQETKVGTGFDVHQLVEGRPLILGGVEIPFEKGLLGHSDADVLTHAIMDALLGAAALGDIGRHFPDSDERYKGISSISLLEDVGNMLLEKGFAIGNIDAVLMAERPKIAPFREQMTENVAKALKISNEKINIKGTTTEKLGFTGREEGIAAQAVCILEGVYRK